MQQKMNTEKARGIIAKTIFTSSCFFVPVALELKNNASNKIPERTLKSDAMLEILMDGSHRI